LLQKIETEKRWFSAVAYSPTADLLATGFDDGTVTLWEWRTGTRTAVLQNDIQNAWVFSVAFSPDGHELAAAGMGWPIRVWNVKTGMLIRQLPDCAIPFQGGGWQESPTAGRSMPFTVGGTALAYSLAFSPDGKAIAAGSKLWLRLWDAASGAAIRTYAGAAEIGGIAFSPDGGLLASSGEDGSIAIWNTNTGTQVRRFQVSRRPLRAVAFSPDGRALATSGWDGNIYIWDWRTSTPVRKISASRGSVNWVFFSPDGTDLASGGRDDSLIAIWHISTGEQLRRISCLSAVRF
jgi:WD40 repeat protein